MKESPKDESLNKNLPHAQEDGMTTIDDNDEDLHETDSTKSSSNFPPTRPYLHSKKLSTEVSPVKTTQLKKISQKTTEVNIPNITVRKTGFRANRRKVSPAQQSDEPVTRKSRHSHCLIPKEILPPLIRSITLPQNKCDVKKHGVVSSPRRSGGDQRHETRFGVDKNRISQRVLSSCRKITTSTTTELSSCDPKQNEKKNHFSENNTKLVPLQSEKSFGDSRSESVILTKSGENPPKTCINQGTTFSVSTSDSEKSATKDVLSRENAKLEPLHLDKSREESTTKNIRPTFAKSGTDVPKTVSILSKSFEGSKSATVTMNVPCNSPRSTDHSLEVQSKGLEKEHLPHLQNIPANCSQQASCPIKKAVEPICSTELMLEHITYVPTMELASESRKTIPAPEDYVVKGKSIQSLARIRSPLYASLEELGKQKNSETSIYLKRLGKGNFLEPLPAELKREHSSLNKSEANLNKLSVLGVGVLQADQESKEMVQPFKEGEDSPSSPETSQQKVTSEKRKSPGSPMKDLYKFACKGIKFDSHGERIFTVADESDDKQDQLYVGCKPQESNRNHGQLGEIEFEDINDKDVHKTVCPQVRATGEDEVKNQKNIFFGVSSGNEFLRNEKLEDSPISKGDREIVDQNAGEFTDTYKYNVEGIHSSQMALKTCSNDDTRIVENDYATFTQVKIHDKNLVASSPRCETLMDDDRCDGNNLKAQLVGSSSSVMERKDSLELSSMKESRIGCHQVCYNDDKTTNNDQEALWEDDKSFSCQIQNSEIWLTASQGQDLNVDKEYKGSVIPKDQKHEVAGLFKPRSEYVNFPCDKENTVAEDVTEETPSSLKMIEDEILDAAASLPGKGVPGKYDHDERPKQVRVDHEWYEALERDDNRLEGNEEFEQRETSKSEQMSEKHEYNALLQSNEMEHSFRDEKGSSQGLDDSLGSGSLDGNIPKHLSDSVCLELEREYVEEIVSGSVDCALDSSPDAIESTISEHVNDNVIEFHDNVTTRKGSHSIYRFISKRNMLPVILEGEDSTLSHLHSTDKGHRVQADHKDENCTDLTDVEFNSFTGNRLTADQDKRRHSLETFIEEISRQGNVADEAFSRACQNILMTKSMGELIQRKASSIMDRLHLKIESVGYSEYTDDHPHDTFLDSEEARNLEVETERFMRGMNTIFMTFHRIWVAENDFIRCCDDILRENANKLPGLSSVIAQDAEK
ncbi:hypothetical protein HOLleu_10111 [Holothuria leucospilota]|uniref:Uncharacterized protein n=1 Tax=Holothuria leucospilota TaxID=206669 RepID=A0A9Q1CDQ3_HOLLE|nr:hypothetical protein HOLleu_10111 [Holothuria leucospilota]